MRIALLVIGLLAASPVEAQIIIGPAQITDGDSLSVANTSIRLFGIDAPEGRQLCRREGSEWACGEEAGRQLASFIGGRSVRCEAQDIDQYGRTVATCYAGSMDLAGAMVEAGWALALPQFTDAYVADESRARASSRGIWSSQFDTPAAWRAAQRERPPRHERGPAITQRVRETVLSGCIIKGNRNRRGEWIYHLPGMPYYEQTRPEEWFCTEAQAQAAGYRRAIVR